MTYVRRPSLRARFVVDGGPVGWPELVASERGRTLVRS